MIYTDTYNVQTTKQTHEQFGKRCSLNEQRQIESIQLTIEHKWHCTYFIMQTSLLVLRTLLLWYSMQNWSSIHFQYFFQFPNFFYSTIPPRDNVTYFQIWGEKQLFELQKSYATNQQGTDEPYFIIQNSIIFINVKYEKPQRPKSAKLLVKPKSIHSLKFLFDVYQVLYTVKWGLYGRNSWVFLLHRLVRKCNSP